MKMKMATKIKIPTDIGYQLVLNESYCVSGINLLLKGKVLIKKRFDNAIKINSQKEETELVNKVINECITGVQTSTSQNKNTL